MSITFYDKGEHSKTQFVGYEVKVNVGNELLKAQFNASHFGHSHSFSLAVRQERKWESMAAAYESHHGITFGYTGNQNWFVRGIFPVVQVNKRNGRAAGVYLSFRCAALGKSGSYSICKYGLVGAYLHALQKLGEIQNQPQPLLFVLREHIPTADVFTEQLNKFKIIYPEVNWDVVTAKHGLNLPEGCMK
ncbi:hypothetical protein [Enterovibrio norvegicus]|uniref:hypothetical protein n=1 Tax=Enterovibrio norvegicus TaxID=188144 RepID=UPI000C8549D8|nr:hypothetical protein [Enterovibrio norvegicus]PMH64496.1 hypothetical protein BCU62_15695 [Enterovibrio norvegicus]